MDVTYILKSDKFLHYMDYSILGDHFPLSGNYPVRLTWINAASSFLSFFLLQANHAEQKWKKELVGSVIVKTLSNFEVSPTLTILWELLYRLDILSVWKRLMSNRTDIFAFLLADHCSVIPWVFVLLNTHDQNQQQGLFRWKEGFPLFSHYDDCKSAIDG